MTRFGVLLIAMFLLGGCSRGTHVADTPPAGTQPTPVEAITVDHDGRHITATYLKGDCDPDVLNVARAEETRESVAITVFVRRNPGSCSLKAVLGRPASIVLRSPIGKRQVVQGVCLSHRYRSLWDQCTDPRAPIEVHHAP